MFFEMKYAPRTPTRLYTLIQELFKEELEKRFTNSNKENFAHLILKRKE
jgi:hypothetical protein